MLMLLMVDIGVLWTILAVQVFNRGCWSWSIGLNR